MSVRSLLGQLVYHMNAIQYAIVYCKYNMEILNHVAEMSILKYLTCNRIAT